MQAPPGVSPLEPPISVPLAVSGINLEELADLTGSPSFFHHCGLVRQLNGCVVERVGLQFNAEENVSDALFTLTECNEEWFIEPTTRAAFVLAAELFLKAADDYEASDTGMDIVSRYPLQPKHEGYAQDEEWSRPAAPTT